MNTERVYDETATIVPVSPFVAMTFVEWVRIALTGMVTGVLSMGAMLLMNTFIFSAVLCRPQSAADCSQAPNYAMIVAMVIGALAGLVALARFRVYRPLLVVLAATVGLWGLGALVLPMTWYWSILIGAALFSLAYVLFAWLARIRNFVVAVIVAVLALIVVRIMLSA